MNVLITGANGFIGRHLTKAIISETDWNVVAVDLRTDKVRDMVGSVPLPRFRPIIMDVLVAHTAIQDLVQGADVVIPLAAIATPKTYVQDPLRVFELDFGATLNVVQWCARHKVRLVFPSSSEVYGHGQDHGEVGPFQESSTPLTYGPTKASRWIYACCKQLLERVIIAYGVRDGLRYTIFRPFNWIGPGLDSLDSKTIGSSRVVTEFLGNVLRKEPVKLVDGGFQKRCFTYVGDGIEALLRILQYGSVTDGQIINIGNPGNECSMRWLARKLWDMVGVGELRFEIVPGDEFYGEGYEDIQRRVPAIDKAMRLLGWKPSVGLVEALMYTVEWAVREVK